MRSIDAVTGRLHARRSRARRMNVEPLEGRTLLATFTVTGLDDAGPGSLREAIKRANAEPGPDTIDFAPEVRGTIAPASALPDLTTEITLTGPGAAVLTIGRITAGEGAEVELSGVTISGSDGDSGGGIHNSGTMTVAEISVSGNSASTSGGGIHNSGTMTVIASSIVGNSASGILSARGGGIENSGTLNVVNSTISGNSVSVAGIGAARASGGGINSTGILTVVRSTITGNTVGGRAPENGTGGGIAGDATITNTIIAGNSAPSNPDLAGALNPIGPNLIGDSVDPRLAPLGDYGGSTPTHALLPGSPAIDAGSAIDGMDRDQRGVRRPQGEAPDIGAFEQVSGVSAIVVDPGTGRGPVGASRTVGVAFIVGPALRPLADVPVSFRIVSGPNAGGSGTTDPPDGRTDAEGRIRFSYDGPNGPGVDTIVAVATVDEGTIVAPPITVRRFQPATPADYDGDGRSDLAVYSYDPTAGAGRFTIELSGGGTRTPDFGGPADRPIVGDFDGDGIDDLAVYGFSPDDGFSRYALIRSSDGAASFGGFGGPADRPIVGDFDGDGRSDLAVYGLGPDGGARFAVLPSSDPDAAYLVPFGGPGDLPLAGDFDGDGIDDLAVYGFSPDDGFSRFAIRPSSDPEDAYPVAFGGAGDGPVVGDFDGDGIDDVAVYGFSPDDGFSRFAIQPSGDPANAYPVAFGGGQDAPIAADSDGDGRTDVAVYGFSPLDGAARFAVLRSSDGRASSTPLGTADSVGLPTAPGRFRPPTTTSMRTGAAAAALRTASDGVGSATIDAMRARRGRALAAWALLVDAVLGQGGGTDGAGD